MGRLHATHCIHRWVLGEPHRGRIRGVCRRCGARRSYPSGLEFQEAVTDYEELDRSRFVRSIEVASLGEQLPA